MQTASNYQPIPCSEHDHYELACIRQSVHTITWVESNHEITEALTFLDLEYKADGEFLIAKNAHGKQFRVRLDQIKAL